MGVDDRKQKARIALVLDGDPSLPGSWSGVPWRLGKALEALDCEVVPINAEIPRSGLIARLLRRNWAEQAASRIFADATGLTATLRLRGAGHVDGVVMMGSGYVIKTAAPVVTFEDMTVVQAVRQGGAVYETLSDSQIARWRDRQRRTYESCRACCTASHWAAESIRNDYAVPQSKIHVVGFGHNVEMEKPSRSWDVPHFLWVGADWSRKRGAAIVESFRKVRDSYPEATLDLVGAHPEVNEEGVIGHGRLALGSKEGQREYADLLRRATCYVMPSSNEPLGIAYIDAATAGVPSIGTTSGGARDAVANCGRIVDPFDQAALERAMLEMCDPALAKELGDRARIRSDVYTWRAVAERILKALDPEQVDVAELASYIDHPSLAQAA